jgi:hypothetical protein
MTVISDGDTSTFCPRKRRLSVQDLRLFVASSDIVVRVRKFGGLCMGDHWRMK